MALRAVKPALLDTRNPTLGVTMRPSTGLIVDHARNGRSMAALSTSGDSLVGNKKICKNKCFPNGAPFSRYSLLKLLRITGIRICDLELNL